MPRPNPPSLAAALSIAAILSGVMLAPAWAAEQSSHGPSEAIFVVQLMVLLLVGRLLGEALLRLRQPAVMGQLMAGLVLGPSLLGALFPELQHALFPPAKEQKAMLDAMRDSGWIGWNADIGIGRGASDPRAVATKKLKERIMK